MGPTRNLWSTMAGGLAADRHSSERNGRVGSGRVRSRRLPGTLIAVVAIIAGLVGVAAPAGANPAPGPPGTMTSSAVTAALAGSFATIRDKAKASLTTDYPTWVASVANDQMYGTITPSTSVDNHLASMGAADCVLQIARFNLKVTGAQPLNVNVAPQIGPLTSTLPLTFTIPPSLNIGPLTAPSGAGTIVVKLKAIAGTVDCYTSGGTAVVTNGVVGYTTSKPELAQTAYGTPQAPGGIAGTVTDNASTPNPISNARVDACTIDWQCSETYSGSGGAYNFSGLQPGPYYLIAYPPVGNSSLQVGQFGPVTVVASATSVNNTVVLDAIEPLPAGVTISNNAGSGPQSNPPFEYWSLPFDISVTGCTGGSATWQLQGWNVETVTYTTLTGPMAETPANSGTYTGTVPPVRPLHGPMQITMTINCPNSTVQTKKINPYIDPSGTVVDQNGVPISGATVTLYDSSSLSGPWTAVANGDTAIMSPSNTNNPDTTGGVGQYGWDVAPGFYEVTATASGCDSTTSPALTIPPPVVDMTLTLTCGIPTGKVSLVKGTRLTLSAVACSSVKGNTAGTISVGKCSPESKVDKAATGPGAETASGLTLTWSPSGQTTVLSALSVSSPGQGGCPAGSTEYDVTGTVTGGTSTYTSVGGTVSAHLCVT
jgi:hypothetical protein